MSEEKLMPCPFCGGEPEFRSCGHEPFVKCGSCGCRTDWHDNQQGAADAWNTRPAREEVSGEEVERVARALCEASSDQWRTNEGMSAQAIAILNQDGLNNHWRHKARAAIAAMNPKPAEAASGAGEPVAWTGSGSLAALKAGREGFIWPEKSEAHPPAADVAGNAPQQVADLLDYFALKDQVGAMREALEKIALSGDGEGLIERAGLYRKCQVIARQALAALPEEPSA